MESLNRPGGNITGMSAFATELAGKRLELAGELLPAARLIGYLLNTKGVNASNETTHSRDAASALGLKLHILDANSADDFDAAFADAAKHRVDGIIIAGGEPVFVIERRRLVALAGRHAIPAIYPWRDFVAAGGLISYGTNLPDLYRRAAIYAGRILKREKPANLPVMQPTKFDLALNLNAAKAPQLPHPARAACPSRRSNRIASAPYLLLVESRHLREIVRSNMNRSQCSTFATASFRAYRLKVRDEACLKEGPEGLAGSVRGLPGRCLVNGEAFSESRKIALQPDDAWCSRLTL